MNTVFPAPRFDLWPGRECVRWLEPRIKPVPPQENLIKVWVQATQLYTSLYVPGKPLIVLDEIAGTLGKLCIRVWEHCLEHDVNPAGRYELETLAFWLEHFSDPTRQPRVYLIN